MAAIDFPTSPTVGQTVTVGDITWRWTGDVWQSQGTIIAGPAGANGTAGPAGADGEANFSSFLLMGA
jgi:hypothetical protein